MRRKQHYKTKPMVILLDHIHALLKLPKDEDDYSMHWRKIKSYFTKAMINAGVKLNKDQRGEYNLW